MENTVSSSSPLASFLQTLFLVLFAFVNFLNLEHAEQFRNYSPQYSRTFMPGCQRTEFSFTAHLGEELGDSMDFPSLGLISLTFFSVCRASSTVAPRSTLTHSMRMLILATCAFPFAFVLPVGTHCTQVADFLEAGLMMNIVAAVSGTFIIYGMESSLFVFENSFPGYACFDPCTCFGIADEEVANFSIFHSVWR